MRAYLFYYNQGNGNFVAEPVLEVSPQLRFQFILNCFDFNEDGHPDIIYTNGDNCGL